MRFLPREHRVSALPPDRAPASPRVGGTCHACFAYDIGLSVDLDRASTFVGEATRRQQLPVQRRRGAPWLAYEPVPLCITLRADPIELGGFAIEAAAECTVFDFGGVSVRYRIPLDAPLAELPTLADALYENPALLDASRRLVEQLCATLTPAITRPRIAAIVEDYTVFAIGSWEGGQSPEDLLAAHGPCVARILRAETGPLSEQQTRESLAERVSFGPGDAVLASWENAVVLDPDAADVLTVLEHVNIELAEMRLLDRTLDEVLVHAYALMQRHSQRRFWPRGPGPAGLREIALAQMDAAMLFESVDNSIKLVGDQHLARVYDLAAARVHLAEWDAAILRKLQTAESTYQKLGQFETGRRMEVLEIIIIVLIAVSILLPFLPGGGH